jgi:hypothetical protein
MMLNNGSKYFIGLTVLAAVSLGVYMALIGPSALGATALFGLVAALSLLATMAVFTHDGDTELGDSSAIVKQPTTSMWPLVGAVGVALLLVGTITAPIVTLFGILALAATLVEWAVQAWSERASSDAAYNATLRKRLMNPLEFPVLAALGLGVIIFSFSRIMLAIDKSAGAVIFIVISTLVLLVGVLFAFKPELKRSLVLSICVVGALGTVVAGVGSMSSGLREDLASAVEEGHYLHRECGAEASKYFDKLPLEGVSLTSSIDSVIELSGGKLTAQLQGSNAVQQSITVRRSNPTNIIFRNLDDGEYRLVAHLGEKMVTDGVKEKVETCTQLIPQGSEQLLTLNIPKPAAEGKPFFLEVAGLSGQSIEVVVP